MKTSASPAFTFPSTSSSVPTTTTTHASTRFSLKCLRCSCHGQIIHSTDPSSSFSPITIQSNCLCLCCHSKDSNCVYCAIDQCIECHHKYLVQLDDNNNYYFSCPTHCHHQKSAFSDNFNSLSRHRINRRIPPSYKTLLHSSVLAGDPDLTWDLLLKGANPFVCDATGVTPIDLAKLLRVGKIQTSANERKIFEILPKISFPETTIVPPEDTRLRTQSDCGPERPNTFLLSPKKPKRKQPIQTESHRTNTSRTEKSPKKKPKGFGLSVTTENLSHRYEGSFLESSELSPYAPPPFISPKVVKKKRSMTMSSSSSQQFPPETPRRHIHNNTFSKSTSHMLSKKERAMTFSEQTSSLSISLNATATDPSATEIAPPLPPPPLLSYGKTRRERAQTMTDSSPKHKIIKDGKVVSSSWDTNEELVSKRPLLRGLVQTAYRLAISNAPDLLKGKQVFTPLTLLKLSSDNNDDLTPDDPPPPLVSPLHSQPHFQPTMTCLDEAEADSEESRSQESSVKHLNAPVTTNDEWLQWEIAQFRELIIGEVEVEIPYSQKKASSRASSALTSRTGSYVDISSLDKENPLSRNTSLSQLSLSRSTKGVASTSTVNEFPKPSTRSVTPPPSLSALQAPKPVRAHSHTIQGVATRPTASSSPKPRVNLTHIGTAPPLAPPPLAPDASGEEVANAFANFAKSMTSSTATPPPLLPKHLKVGKSGNVNTPPRSPAVVSEIDDTSKTPRKSDPDSYDNSESVDISAGLDSLVLTHQSQPPPLEEETISLTCTGCYDELPASLMAYTCSRMGCMSHLCQDCIFRSVFVTITSALYSVPRIKCPGRCMHAIPTRIWRGILRGMKMSDEDKLTIKVEDQYPILRLLDLLYESFELFCSDYEGTTNTATAIQSSSTGKLVMSPLEMKYVHMSDMLKRVETIVVQDGYTLTDLYNTVYEIDRSERRGEEESDDSNSDESDDDDNDDENTQTQILPENTLRVDLNSFDAFAQLVYPHKVVQDDDLEKSFLLMEDLLNDSEIESNRLGVNKIRKLRLCVFLSHAAVIIRTRLNPTHISTDSTVGGVGVYVMNIYHNDAESLLMKKYIHNANALLTIRCGGCDDTVSLFYILENGKFLIFEKNEREKVLNKILGQLQSQPQSQSLSQPQSQSLSQPQSQSLSQLPSKTTHANMTLLFLRNWIHFVTNRIPAVTFVANIISFYLQSIVSMTSLTHSGSSTSTTLTNSSPKFISSTTSLESQLELGILPTELLKYFDQILSLILDSERRFAAQLEIYRKFPKIRVPCCETKHCFLCKVQGHHKTKTCSEIQNNERGLNCQYCPGCGVATLRTEGCMEILCVCGSVWKWKLEAEKKRGVVEGSGEGEEKGEGGVDGESSSQSDDEDEDSSSDSWDDDDSDDSED
jgi:hypothetical protein